MITGKNCKIGENLKILGNGAITLKNGVKIGDNVTINVSEKITIGDRSTIGDSFLLAGRDLEIGTEFWSGHHCQIGGGSCFEKTSSLRLGYWCHLGDFGFINTARQVRIGNEVGMGIGTKIYTHGAYLSFLDGFPVDFGPIEIGDNVWLPGATVLPNVRIGNNVVIGVGSVVTKSLPAGCLAAGVPARVIREQYYPKQVKPEERTILVKDFVDHFKKDILTEPIEVAYEQSRDVLKIDTRKAGLTEFRISEKRIVGIANSSTEVLRNELRRHGVRFRSYPEEGLYVQW
jgi:acetyltransferase-like isoleucine patch superfamily enzyme